MISMLYSNHIAGNFTGCNICGLIGKCAGWVHVPGKAGWKPTTKVYVLALSHMACKNANYEKINHARNFDDIIAFSNIMCMVATGCLMHNIYEAFIGAITIAKVKKIVKSQSAIQFNS